MLVPLLTVAAGYFIGAIPFGYLIARSRGVDIFEHGSGNIGATNVARVLGRRFGLLVFALDFAKGAVPVALALWLRGDSDSGRHGWIEVGAGLAAFLGHLFPIYLRFRGGKGVATGAGVVAMLLPAPALAALLAWFVVVLAFRYVSLASVVAVLVLCLVQFAAAAPNRADPRSLFCLVAAALVIGRHRANLARLARGVENQLEDRPALAQARMSLHVLALGLWFGTAVFFSFVVGLSLFSTFERVGQAEPRPGWLPHSAAFAKVDAEIDGPKEQGMRVAGAAVGPLFAWYFALQGVCAFSALVTALSWAGAGRLHRLRVYLIAAALALVALGWPVEQHVSNLRGPRNAATEAYLQAAEGDATARAEMRAARAAFGLWHGYSLLLNFAALACVTAAMALAGNLPQAAARADSTPLQSEVAEPALVESSRPDSV
jgi:acyl-phosphate glycerol 3-phosphate acyltransferase